MSVTTAPTPLRIAMFTCVLVAAAGTAARAQVMINQGQRRCELEARQEENPRDWRRFRRAEAVPRLLAVRPQRQHQGGVHAHRSAGLARQNDFTIQLQLFYF
jgi:hypothetical protein